MARRKTDGGFCNRLRKLGIEYLTPAQTRALGRLLADPGRPFVLRDFSKHVNNGKTFADRMLAIGVAVSPRQTGYHRWGVALAPGLRFVSADRIGG